MSSKKILQDLFQRLPEHLSLDDIAEEIECVAAIRKGIEVLDRGESAQIPCLMRA